MRGGLVLGFGVLLILLILSGLSALHALSEVAERATRPVCGSFSPRTSNSTRSAPRFTSAGPIFAITFWNRIAPKPNRAGRSLSTPMARIQSLLADNGQFSGASRSRDFEALKREIADYWQTLEPVLSWSPGARRQEGYRFLRDEVFPRRSNTLSIADNDPTR